MKKVIYSVTRLSRKGNVKVSGIGYLSNNDLLTAQISQNNKPYVRVYEDLKLGKSSKTENEFTCDYYEIKEIDLEDDRGKITTKEICLEYKIWFKIIND